MNPDRSRGIGREIQVDKNTKVLIWSHITGELICDVILKRKNRKSPYRKVSVIHHGEGLQFPESRCGDS